MGEKLPPCPPPPPPPPPLATAMSCSLRKWDGIGGLLVELVVCIAHRIQLPPVVCGRPPQKVQTTTSLPCLSNTRNRLVGQSNQILLSISCFPFTSILHSILHSLFILHHHSAFYPWSAVRGFHFTLTGSLEVYSKSANLPPAMELQWPVSVVLPKRVILPGL